MGSSPYLQKKKFRFHKENGRGGGRLAARRRRSRPAPPRPQPPPRAAAMAPCGCRLRPPTPRRRGWGWGWGAGAAGSRLAAGAPALPRPACTRRRAPPRWRPAAAGAASRRGKTALTKGFCDALAAFRCFDGKCAVVDYSIREAATRKGLIFSRSKSRLRKF